MSEGTSAPADEGLLFWWIGPTGDRIAADPYRVERYLAAALQGQPLVEAIEQARGENPAAAALAAEKLLAAVQAAFGVRPIQPDGSGLSEGAQMRLLSEFLEWKTDVKKNTVQPVTSWPATAPASSAGPYPPRNDMRPG